MSDIQTPPRQTPPDPTPSGQTPWGWRFPQPARAGDLVGLPILDEDARTIGHVRSLVTMPDRNVFLIVAHGGLFGFGARLVAVPITATGMLGRQVALLSLNRAAIAALPTWSGTDGTSINPDETIQVGLAQR
jgi:hypothetical protein